MQLISAQRASKHYQRTTCSEPPGRAAQVTMDNLRFLRGKFLTLCLCKIFELLFRHGVNHLF
jgi:hypothetical protein